MRNVLFLIHKNKGCVFLIKLHQGDCLDIMEDISDKSIDLILCDLPYGTTTCKWDTVIPFESLWEQYNRIIKDKGTIVLFASQPFTTKLINSNLRDYKYNWYWVKSQVSGFALAKHQPLRVIEDVCVFYKKHGTYNPQGIMKIDKPKRRIRNNSNKDKIYRKTLEKEYVSTFKNYPKQTLYYKRDSKNRIHPTQKPVALLEYLIKTYTNEGETVLDNCMGSGSTGVACINTNRKFIGMELDEGYFKIAKERINETIEYRRSAESML